MKQKITRRQFLEKVGLVGLMLMGGLSSLSNIKSETSIPNSDCPNCHGIMHPTINPCGEIYLLCGHPASYGVPFSMNSFQKKFSDLRIIRECNPNQIYRRIS